MPEYIGSIRFSIKANDRKEAHELLTQIAELIAEEPLEWLDTICPDNEDEMYPCED